MPMAIIRANYFARATVVAVDAIPGTGAPLVC